MHWWIRRTMEWYLWVSLSGTSSVVVVTADPRVEAASVKGEIFYRISVMEGHNLAYGSFHWRLFSFRSSYIDSHRNLTSHVKHPNLLTPVLIACHRWRHIIVEWRHMVDHLGLTVGGWYSLAVKVLCCRSKSLNGFILCFFGSVWVNLNRKSACMRNN